MNNKQQITNNKLLNIYFTAGYPSIDAFGDIMQGLQSGGVDMIEVGMPYSDPLADGPTIQASNTVALSNGINLNKIFELLSEVKKKPGCEIYLMGYYNQWLSYGLEAFCQRAKEAGVYGLIIPDLPIEYFDEHHQSLLNRYGLKISFLVTPDSDENRIRKIDELSTGFVYIVSSKSTTGKIASVFDANQEYFKRIAAFPFKNKTMIGFGIHDQTGFNQACQFTDGAIIGSAFIRHLEKGSSTDHIISFIDKIRPL